MDQVTAAVRKHRVAIVLISAAAIIRVIYLAEISTSPCMYFHRWQETDMNFFYEWAERIKGGDLLTRASLHPYHGWHDSVAQQHLEKDITMDQGESTGVDEGAKRALWQRWYGGTRYHQEPLYAYFISLLWWLFGTGIGTVFIVQSLLGIVSVWLVYWISNHCFGPVAGLASGSLAVLCGPMLFYEAVLLRTSLMSPVGLKSPTYGRIKIPHLSGVENRVS